ncbi:MAG: biotin--[acetyl-CoA-carboxylase] ligase [Chlorobi bacterium]|nr:biotin--[acetyl-CoA-carboxylase] ligase [Chlorobiota bacterium]
MKTQIIHLPEVNSTNQYLSLLIKKDNPDEGVVVSTDFQKKGRGQRANSWVSERKKNILFSILLKPEFLPISQQFLLSKIVSLSIVEVLTEFITHISIKWPNDIYYIDKKIAGILIENVLLGNKIDSTVVGIGININQIKFISGLPNPISLSAITGKCYNNNELLSELLISIDKWYAKLKKGDVNEINELYYNRLYLLNKLHTFKKGNKKIAGKITGVSKVGKLIVENLQRELVEYNFKEIEF